MITQKLLASLLFVLTTSVLASNAAPPKSAPATASPQPGGCVVRVFDISPVNSRNGKTASVWAVSLRTKGTVHALKATGIMSLVSDAQRYDVAFKDFAVPNPRDEATEVPLLVSFPKLVRLVSGYVASVDAPGEGACDHVSAFSDEAIDERYDATLFARTKTSVVLNASHPEPHPHAANCVDDGSQTGATIVKVHDEPGPALSKEMTATVALDLSDAGNPWDAAVSESSGDATLDALALRMAKESTYRPGQYHCRPYGGRLLVPITFR